MLNLQSFLQTLTANGTPVVIIAVGVPGAVLPQMVAADVAVQKGASMNPAAASAAATATASPAAVSHPASAPPAAVSVARTPLERLQLDEQRHGQQKRQAKEWAPLLKVSARELERALKAGALAFEVEKFGRGHGARLINTSDLRTYLETVDAVEQGRMTPAPSWYSKVRASK